MINPETLAWIHWRS